jgi:uncharacterized protein (DUF2249 family)
MNETVTATEMRARTLQAVLQRQRTLASGLARRAADIREAAGQHGAWSRVHDLVDFVAGQVLPYTSAEEETVYAAARSRHQLPGPVTGMVNEHERLASMSSRLADATRLVAATEQAEALATAFASHLAEERSLLPEFLAKTDINPAEFVARMDRLSRKSWVTAALDVRGLEPALRQRVVFERFEGLPPGGSFALVGDALLESVHYQLEAKHGDEVAWEVLEAGPPVWRARVGWHPIGRLAAATPHRGMPQLALFETGPLRTELAASDDGVRRLSPAAQEQRLAELIDEAFAVYKHAVERIERSTRRWRRRRCCCPGAATRPALLSMGRGWLCGAAGRRRWWGRPRA